MTDVLQPLPPNGSPCCWSTNHQQREPPTQATRCKEHTNPTPRRHQEDMRAPKLSSHSLPKANIRVNIQVQLLGVLPVTSTWQHSREHNKTSGVIMPHGPVQSLNLFPHRRKLLLPWDLPTPAPMIHTVGPQEKGNHSQAAHSNVSEYDSLCSIFECFTTQRVMWPKFVWG